MGGDSPAGSSIAKHPPTIGGSRILENCQKYQVRKKTKKDVASPRPLDLDCPLAVPVMRTSKKSPSSTSCPHCASNHSLSGTLDSYLALIPASGNASAVVSTRATLPPRPLPRTTGQRTDNYLHRRSRFAQNAGALFTRSPRRNALCARSTKQWEGGSCHKPRHKSFQAASSESGSS